MGGTPQALSQPSPTRRLGQPLVRLETTTSTNDEARQGARGGAPHGATWVAREQEAGRGRQGRSWFSPPGEGLLISVLLRAPCAPSRVPLLALAAGLSVRDTAASFVGSDAWVKWPNDVLVRGIDGKLQKIAGVLVESSVVGSRVEHVIVGVGVNVFTREFPPEIAERTTSLALECEARGIAAPPDMDGVLDLLLRNLDADLHAVAAGGLGPIHARLNEADVLRGQSIALDRGGMAVAAGINPDGRLRVTYPDGALDLVASGEIHLGARLVGS